eukprot:1002955_1
MSVLTDAIIRVDIDSLDPQVLSELSKAAIETGNPLKAKKRDFQCFCGIHFGTVETSYAIALPSGKIIMDNQFSGDAHHKDKTNVLLRPNPPYEIIAFGKAATDKYIFTKNKKALYFERFKMSLYDKITAHYSGGDVSCLRAANGTLVPTSIVFQRALEYIKESVMRTLKKAGLKIRRIMDVQWILTVPAIWSNYEKSIMHKAALDAGINKRGIDD